MNTAAVTYILVILFAIGFAAWSKHLIGVRRTQTGVEFAIGIYKLHDENGKLTAIAHPGVINPVLTGQSISDNNPRFVADPFVVYDGSQYNMFFEALSIDGKGEIALATSSDGIKWKYANLVLVENFHLSYPCVFRWKDSYYMIPESYQDLSIRLYKAEKFPDRWKFVKKMIEGDVFVDSTIFYYQNTWYLFTCTNENQTLWLYYSSSPDGKWIKHPKSPIVKKDSGKARPGGHVINWKGKLLRIAQNDTPNYGYSLRAFEIIRLSRLDYEERELPESPVVQASGTGWNADGMHQLSIYTGTNNEIIAVVDGKKNTFRDDLYVRLPSWIRKLHHLAFVRS
jgi:hypothetical protein